MLLVQYNCRKSYKYMVMALEIRQSIGGDIIMI